MTNKEKFPNKDVMNNAMKFAASIVFDYKFVGPDVLEENITFNEKELYEIF